jgi:hypothetical protein
VPAAADSWYHEKGSAWQMLIGGGAGLAAWSIGRLLGASVG